MPQLITAASAIRISRICRNNPLPIIFRFRDDISSWLLYILLLKFYFAGPGGEIGLSALLPKRPTSLSLLPPENQTQILGALPEGATLGGEKCAKSRLRGKLRKERTRKSAKIVF